MNTTTVYLIIGIIGSLSAWHSLHLNETPQADSSGDDISYHRDIKPIMTNYCVTCHSGENAAAGFALSTYEEVRLQAEHGELLKRINDKKRPMPKGGLMPRKMRWTIKKWADQGFKKGKMQDLPIPPDTDVGTPDFLPSAEATAINSENFEFFQLMQGHWVGDMNIMGQKYDWFSFDYRPISAAHVHGIFEGGSMGNLFTSFFIVKLNGKKTIMARNGGVLNGIYRTSYFVLDKVDFSNGRKYFRFVDAYGGKDIMWMELEFEGDGLKFNSYTSRFGLNGAPKPHMRFKATKKHEGIAQAVAKELGYPKNEVEFSFPKGLPTPDWGEAYPTVTSASYIYQDSGEDLLVLAKKSGDPIPIGEMPYLAKLKANIAKNPKLKDQKLIIYLSKDPLTDDNGKIIMEYGYIKQELFDGVLSFPEISPNLTEFTFTYLHPGNYYLTLVADTNGDGYISKGDITSKSLPVDLEPYSEQSINVGDFLSQN